MKNARAKLTDVLECLVVQQDDLPERIAHCYTHQLSEFEIEKLPNNLQPGFRALMTKLGNPAARHEGEVRQYIRALNSRECAAVARDMLKLTLALYAHMGEDELASL